MSEKGPYVEARGDSPLMPAIVAALVDDVSVNHGRAHLFVAQQFVSVPHPAPGASL